MGWWLWPATAQALTLTVSVEGLRPGGQVRAGVYVDPARWLEEGGAVASCVADVEAGAATCSVELPGPGTYAVAFHHDQDGDGVFDRMLGVPLEGWGFSRDAATGLSGPRFADAALQVSAGSDVHTTIRARYL